MTTDTPRTDAEMGYEGSDEVFYKNKQFGPYVQTEFARQLERELSEARAKPREAGCRVEVMTAPDWMDITRAVCATIVVVVLILRFPS